MSELQFKGKGEHSVSQLEQICLSQKEALYYKQIDNQNLLEQKKELLEAVKECYEFTKKVQSPATQALFLSQSLANLIQKLS